MQRSLRDHILSLELRLQALRDQLTTPGISNEEYNRIESTIRVVELALRYYRKAFELEQKIA